MMLSITERSWLNSMLGDLISAHQLYILVICVFAICKALSSIETIGGNWLTATSVKEEMRVLVEKFPSGYEGEPSE
jgi:hypothetical protein